MGLNVGDFIRAEFEDLRDEAAREWFRGNMTRYMWAAAVDAGRYRGFR
jgi:hypothetical protein